MGPRRPEAMRCGGKWVRYAEPEEAELPIGQIAGIVRLLPFRVLSTDRD